MFKKKFLFILLTGFVALAGYFFFKFNKHSSAFWGLVSESASIVVVSEHLQDSTYMEEGSNLDLKRLPILDLASDNLSLLNTFIKNSKKRHHFLKNKQIVYSFHSRTATEWGITIYIPITEEEQKVLRPDNTQVRIAHHNFQDTQITDLVNSKGQPLFSYIIKNGYFIASYYGDLVEEAVRTSSINLTKSDLNSRFSQIANGSNSTHVYLNTEAWKSIIDHLQDGLQQDFLKLLPQYHDLHLALSQDSSIVITSLGSKTSKHYLTQLLKDRPASIFTNYRHIPLQTAQLYRYATKKEADFPKKFAEWHNQNKTAAWEKLSYYLGSESNKLIANMGSELLLCQLETSNRVVDGKLLMVDFSNYDKLRPLLKKLAQLSSKQVTSSHDTYQGYDLYSIDIQEFPSAIFGEYFRGFPKSYVTYLAPYLVFSNYPQVLQSYIVDFENGLTWNSSPEMANVLNTSMPTAQISIVADIHKLRTRSGKVYDNLNTKIESVVVQCNLENDRATPQIVLNPKARPTAARVLNKTFLNVNIEWPVQYDKYPAVLQNPIDGSTEMLFTDQNFNLLKVEDLQKGTAKNIEKLNGNLVTDSYKADFLNIGRQQRIFATANTVYTLDEDERGIYTLFKQPIPSLGRISDLYITDGGTDGSSRFIIKDTNSELFIWENTTRPIRKITAGTKLNNILGPVIALNQIGNRGFVATQGNGQVYLFSENGSVRSGFPVDILTSLSSPFTWAQNPLTGQAELLGISHSGELITIALDGKIISRKQLLRPEQGASFRILYDRQQLDWILIRSTRSKTAVLSKEGVELFEIKDILPNPDIQYHYFGSDNRFITIRSGNFTTIFDMTGKRLGNKAIPSESPVEVTYQPGYYKMLIFSRFETKFQVWSIKLR